MMMKSNSKLTNETTTFQCHHNNTGFCKFGNQCKYLHFHTICLENICRNQKCPNRHPKTCRFGDNCKFNSRKACVYRHDKIKDIESMETKNLIKQIKALEDDLKDLQAKISELKNEHDIIINNLTKKVDELQAEKGYTDMRQNSDIERSCEKCDETFVTEVNLKDHLDTKHGKAVIQVEPVSPKNIKTKEIKESDQVFSMEKSFKCERCGKVLKSQSSLQEHKYRHCGVCGKIFTNIIQLKKHSRSCYRPY